MRVIPEEVLLSWPTPNYVNPATRGPGLVIVNGIMIALVVLTVLMRMYTRIFILRWLGLDDLFILIATIFTIGMTTCVILANVDYGWDRHIWDLPPEKFGGTMKIALASKLVFALATGFTRLSLLVFYYRLVRESGLRWFRNFLHICVFINVTAIVLYIMLTIFQCAPIRAFWTYPALPNQRCFVEGKINLGSGIVNAVMDLLTTIIPIPLIARLQLPWRKRLGAIILVSLGFVVTVAGAIRSYYTWLSLLASYDETWYCYGLWLASAVEIDLGVICACAPALRILFVKNIGSISYSSKKERTGSHKLSDLQAFSYRRNGHHTLQSINTNKNVDLLVSRGRNREDTEEEDFWDKPWSGNGILKSRRASTDISGKMSPVRIGKASFDMIDKFGTRTTITAGDDASDAHLVLGNSSVRDLSNSSASSERGPTATGVNVSRHTSIKVKVERKREIGVLEDADADAEYEKSSIRIPSEDDFPLPIQWDVEKGVPRKVESGQVRPSSAGRTVEARRGSDGEQSWRGRSKMERWREKEQKQQGYGWSLGT